MRTFTIAICIALGVVLPASAQQSADEARAEATKMMGGTPLPDIENYPDFATGAAWNWMKVMESGEGPLDPKTSQLIGLAVAAQIPCLYCIRYHSAAAKAAGATDQEIAHAAALAGYTRHWSTVLYGTQVDVEAYHEMVSTIFSGD
jgi:AhpD family alkylhydroperoxidase